jgi:hypothetical protein
VSLFRKAWCETRARFAIGLGTLAVMIPLVVARAATPAEVWAAVYGDAIQTIFVLIAIVLGTGSLRQERALGTLGFSLALPVPRARLVLARAAVGLAEVWLLAGFVAAWVPIVAAITGPGYPISQSLPFSLLWAAVGSLIFSLTQLFASLIASDYLTWLLTFLLILGYQATLQLTALRQYPRLDLYRLMSGQDDLPWLAISSVLAVATALLGLAIVRTRRLAL